MPAIPTSNILQPGQVAIVGGANRALVSFMQLLTPQYDKMYGEKYGNESYSKWLMTYAGQEVVKNRDFFWFENRGKLMPAVTIVSAVTSTAGSTVSGTITAGTTYNSLSPLRVGETFRVATTDTEFEILTVPTVTTFTARPKLAAITETIAAGEVLILGGFMDVGERSTTGTSLAHLDVKYTNTTTEMRETFTATDLAEMAEVFYTGGFSGTAPAGGGQAGTSMYTLKSLVKASQRYLNNMDDKLMRGNAVTNTGLATTTSVGTVGLIPKVLVDGELVGYTAGTIDIAKMHEITRVLDVNGGAKENMWLMDINQRQNFDDGLFAAYPAGSWVWGANEKSQEAQIAYGTQSIAIDGYKFNVKKHVNFNSEVKVGLTPANDYLRNFGIIMPMGEVRSNSGEINKNVTLVTQQPVGGGTIGNGIRVWQHGGGSMNPTNGTMEDNVEMISYKALKVAGANQFVIVKAS